MLTAARWFVRLVARLVPGGARREFRDEWDAELACHWQEVARAGRPAPRELAVVGLRAAGALPDAIALLRQEWSLDMLLQDLRYGARLLGRRFGFTALVVVTLALGIGANTAVFSVVDGVLLRPLPFPDAERLLVVWEDDRLNQKPRYPVAPANYLDWLSGSRAFESLSAYVESTMDLTGTGEPARVGTAVVWPTFFDALRVAPLMGRTFAPDDAKGQGSRVVVVSHAMWQTRLSADPSVIGRELMLGGRAFRVVGVMPPGFTFPGRAVDLWRPLVFQADTATARAVHFLTVIGRLRADASIEQARAELGAIAARAQQLYPKTNDRRGVTVVPLQEEIVGDVRRWLYAVAGGVAIVLLIGCANVANLLLAAANGRRREIAVRAALGAGRMRLIRQLVVEGLVLAACGGVAGVLLAVWFTRTLAVTGTEWLPRAAEVVVDVRVLAFASAISLFTGVLFALFPAVHASRADLHETLKDGGRGGQPARGRRAGAAIVVAELALAVVLAIGAGLLVRSFWKVQQIAAGFEPRGVLSASIEAPAHRYAEGPAIVGFYRTLLDRLETLPGVRAAGAVNALPLGGPGPTSWLTIEGRPPHQGEPPEVGLRAAAGRYFQAMRIPLVHGRLPEWTDTFETQPVLVINQALAQRFFPGQDPMGVRIRLGPNPKTPWRTIVGVVGDVRHDGVEKDARPEVYLPLGQIPWTGMTLTLRADDPAAIIPALRATVQTLDPNLPLSRVSTMDAVLAESLARRRLTMILLGSFAALALLLAIVGVYGVLAYAVGQRRQEIGLRMAVGARASQVVALVVRQGMSLAAAGLAVGLVAAFALNRGLAALLFGIQPTDPATYAGVAAAILIAAAAACYVPARRASRIDPVAALRD